MALKVLWKDKKEKQETVSTADELIYLEKLTKPVEVNITTEQISDWKEKTEKFLTEHQALPTKLSDFEDDKHFLTEHQSLKNYYTKQTIDHQTHLMNEKINNIEKKVDAMSTSIPSSIPTAISDYNQLTNKPFIPTMTSELINNSGFITKNDIPNIKVPTKFSELVNDQGFVTLNMIPATPKKTSELINDSHFITKNDLPVINIPTVPNKMSAFENDMHFITNVDIPKKISNFENDAHYVKHEELPVLPKKLSDLENDLEFDMSPIEDRIFKIEEQLSSKTNAKFLATSILKDYNFNTRMSELTVPSITLLDGSIKTAADLTVGDKVYVIEDGIPNRLIGKIADGLITLFELESEKIQINNEQVACKIFKHEFAFLGNDLKLSINVINDANMHIGDAIDVIKQAATISLHENQNSFAALNWKISNDIENKIIIKYLDDDDKIKTAEFVLTNCYSDTITETSVL